MLRVTSVYVLAVLSTSVLFGSETRAQAGDDTIELVARGSVPLEAGSVFELRPREDRPEYEALGEQIRQRLADQNYVTTKRSDLILRYEYRISNRVGAPNDKNISFEARADTAKSSDVRLSYNLREKSSISSSRHLVLQFELYRPGSPAIWTARVIAPDDQLNRDFLLEQMVGMAIKNIGITNNSKIEVKY